MNKIPRGIRNNNPGNIDRTAERWIGMAADQSGDSRFVVFESPEYGIRALMRLLVTYQDRHGLKTVRQIINRWAPPVENNTSAYVNQVAAALGVGPDEEINTLDRATNEAMTRAIIRHECGDPAKHGYPHDWYPDAIYTKAAALAGFKGDVPRLRESKTIAGSVAAGAATVAGAVYETAGPAIKTASDAVGPLALFGPSLVKWLLAGIALAGIAVAIYARVKDQAKRVS